MKKFITLAMTFIMIIVMATSSFAATVADGGSESGNVEVIINKDAVTTVYSVDIAWDSLEFTYNLGNGRWDPTDHTVEGGSAGWNIDSAKITVTNHSNAAVNIEAAFADEPTTATVNGVTATLTNNTFTLDAGKLNKYAEADYAQTTVTVSGTPSTEDTFTVGTITVTVSAAS